MIPKERTASTDLESVRKSAKKDRSPKEPKITQILTEQNIGDEKPGQGQGKKESDNFANKTWVYEKFDGKLLNPTEHVRIPRVFRWIDIKSVTVDSTKKLFVEVYTHEVVLIFPSKEERLLLLSEVGPSSQQ
ncbi:hypothetical protein Droror1_Dr00002385 [Drosera rotundifolia]